MKLKHLAILTGTLLALVLVIFLVRDNSKPEFAGRVGKPIMEGVDLSEAAKVSLQKGEKSTTLVLKESGEWQVEQQAHFPANIAKLRMALVELSESPIHRLVTTKPEKLGKLGLLTKEENKGKFKLYRTGIRLRVENKNGKALLDLIVGNTRSRPKGGNPMGGHNKNQAQFIRLAGEKAGYLLGQEIKLDTDSSEWLDNKLFPFEAPTEIQQVTLLRANGEKLDFSREKATDPWTLKGVKPKDLDQREAGELARRFSKMKFHLVETKTTSPKALGREKRVFYTLKLFDKRVYEMEMGEKKGAEDFRYMTLVAKGENTEEARTYNKKFGNRMIAAYNWEGEGVLKSRSDFLKKKPVPPKAKGRKPGKK